MFVLLLFPLFPSLLLAHSSLLLPLHPFSLATRPFSPSLVLFPSFSSFFFVFFPFAELLSHSGVEYGSVPPFVPPQFPLGAIQPVGPMGMPLPQHYAMQPQYNPYSVPKYVSEGVTECE